MAWTDEIGEAAYTAPSGKRTVFNFDSGLERTTALKTAENTFPDVDGAEVQSLGLGGKKFPMTAIFSGADCLAEASAFEDLLCERGYGILEHPIYGKHTVVPTGEIARSDDLVSALNESRVKVTFSETITDRAFPDSEVAASDALDAATDAYEDAAAKSFADLIETGSVDDEIQLQATLKKQSDSLFKGLDGIAGQAASTEQRRSLSQTLKGMKENVKKWTGSIDVIAGNAIDVAHVIQNAARLPSQLAIGGLAKIEGYSSVMKDLLANAKKDPFGTAAIKNQYAATSLMFGAMLAAMSWGVAKDAVSGGAAEAATYKSRSFGGFASRADVLSAADAVLEQFEAYKEYMDAQVGTGAFVDDGGTYAALLQTVLAAVQVLEEASFVLPVMRVVRLDRDRQLFELLTELYGAEGFDRQDEFITDNKLTADEIVLLPMGREVRYYG